MVYFNIWININDFDFKNIILDEKSDKDTFIYSIVHKIAYSIKSLYITFPKTNGFIKDCDIYDGLTKSKFIPGNKQDKGY